MSDDLHAYIQELEAALGRHTEELRRSRDLLRIVFDNLPEGLLLIDAAGALLAANNAFCRQIVGRRPQEVVGMDYRQLWVELAANGELSLSIQGPGDEAAAPAPPADQPFGDHAVAWRILCTDTVGQERWYSVERVPLGEGPFANQWLERWRDVTRHEELQRRLLLHDQLASLGRLAASVAHEVGNPLQSAMACLELCREDRDIPTSPREYLTLAIGELERMARTMERLRHLYRPPQLTWEPVDLNQILHQVGQFTRRQLHQARVQLDLDLEDNLPSVVGQADALRQVFLNLILNAQEAMPQGGTVTVSSHRKETDRLCLVTVSDSGVGMSAEQLGHLFEPFRSGKAQGVGLGLYLSRQIIEQHTGHIEVKSQPDQGTKITVLLPWSDAPPQRTPDEE
jgi:signal transduction histidine kinase